MFLLCYSSISLSLWLNLTVTKLSCFVFEELLERKTSEVSNLRLGEDKCDGKVLVLSRKETTEK
jgi:hypothetical protein